MRVLGIDEAGRGCVLGDLVVGAFLIDDPDDEVLRALGVKDSKRLSAKRRQAVRAILGDHGTEDTRLIDAPTIDQGNLNELEEDAVVDLVRTHQPDLILIDALGHPSTIPGLVARLRRRTGVPAAWEMKPKADHIFPVVGAASIVAKTTRDARLGLYQVGYPDFGSGYPSDPKTRAWLEQLAQERQGWPPFVRTRWGTVRDLEQRYPGS
jgi:ribonuclease HII